VSQEITKKIPVEYHKMFLETYEPNITHYLNPKERELLLEMGTPFNSEKKSGTFVKNILNH
jgi:hypothetical protein